MKQLYFKIFTNHTASEWLASKLGAAQFEWNFMVMSKFMSSHWSSWTAVFQGCTFFVMQMVSLVAAWISKTRHFSANAS